MLKKVLIMPYFGAFPPWYEHYIPHVANLADHGYELLIDTDLSKFQDRVRRVLGIECPIVPGTGKVWDYRPALGHLYAEEIQRYDWWGHTDFDCVYGRVSQWASDEFLAELDVHADCPTYVCGPWTLYRNTPAVNMLYATCPDWQSYMDQPTPNGWVESVYSRALEASGLRYRYTGWHHYLDATQLEHSNGRLFDHGHEIFMYHFRRTKQWPLRIQVP